MLISSIINDSFGLLSKQLRFYCWHFRRNLDQRQRQELIELLYEQHFERLASKIKSLNQSTLTDCKQQVGKLLFEHCLTRNRRHQLIQLVESRLVDIDVRLDNYGRTLLHRSAYNLDVELVKILIEHGVNIRLRDYAGNTALHIAIQSYRNGAVIFGEGPDVVQNLTSIIKLLLEADQNMQRERSRRKRIKLFNVNPRSNNGSFDSSPSKSQNLAQDERQSESPTSLLTMKQSDNPYMHHKLALKSSPRGDLEKQKMNQLSYVSPEQNDQDLPKQDHYRSTTGTISPILLEDSSSPLVDTRNAFGRTALHYCVLVIGEQYLSHFVELLISFGADTDVTDARMKTPLYCLVKRPGISAIREKVLAIRHMLESGCDDLGLAIDSQLLLQDKVLEKLQQKLAHSQQSNMDNLAEPIFVSSTYRRVPSLKHLARLHLIRYNGEKNKVKRQTTLKLPPTSPTSLNLYINRKILDQKELF